MKSRLICLSLAAIGMIALANCAKIEEPWVNSRDQLKDERSRSVEEQQALRQRLFLAAGFRHIDLDE
jgi:hypothetical protein